MCRFEKSLQLLSRKCNAAIEPHTPNTRSTVAGPRIRQGKGSQRDVINLISLTLRSFMPVGLEAF